MSFNSNTSVKTIRDKIAHHLKGEPSDIDIFFGDIQMFDDHTLRFYTKDHPWVKFKVKLKGAIRGRRLTTTIRYYDQSEIFIDVD